MVALAFSPNSKDDNLQGKCDEGDETCYDNWDGKVKPCVWVLVWIWVGVVVYELFAPDAGRDFAGVFRRARVFREDVRFFCRTVFALHFFNA